MKKRFVYTAILLLASSSALFACASCGCSIGSDWEDATFSQEKGFKFDLKYDYLDQNKLMSGRSSISAAVASNQGYEVEKYTKNEYITASLDYAINDRFGLNFSLPYIIRDHSTLGVSPTDGVTPVSGGGSYNSKTATLGDAKLIGRYLINDKHNFGILAGLKFATGSHSLMGISTDPSDSAGTSATIDRGLEPGTGTTDVIAGLYYFHSLSGISNIFTQLMYQSALNSSDSYRPGDVYNANIGINYTGFKNIIPKLQMNVKYQNHDTGDNADPVNTGGFLTYLTPGVMVNFDKVTLYSSVQIPVYQYVNGVQLVPDYIVSLGVRYSF